MLTLALLFHTDGNQTVVCRHHFDNPVLFLTFDLRRTWQQLTKANGIRRLGGQAPSNMTKATKPCCALWNKNYSNKHTSSTRKITLLTDSVHPNLDFAWFFASKPLKPPPRCLGFHAAPLAAAAVELHRSVVLRHVLVDVEATAWAKWTW